jgi:hypothetical protein
MLTTFAPAGGGDEGCGCQPPACILQSKAKQSKAKQQATIR